MTIYEYTCLVGSLIWAVLTTLILIAVVVFPSILILTGAISLISELRERFEQPEVSDD